MIGWGDVYNVAVAMVPLYVSLGLGYFSVKWWLMFSPDHCNSINRFNCYFILPFFNFQFASGINPYHMNYRFLAGDIVAKAIIGIALVLWVKLWRKGSFSWAITSFNILCFSNTLVVGVPMLEPIYGALGRDIVVQSSIIQNLIWFPLLLFMLELRRAISFSADDGCHNSNDYDLEQPQGMKNGSVETVMPEVGANATTATTLDDKNDQLHEDENKVNSAMKSESTTKSSSSLSLSLPPPSSCSFGSTMNKVLAKLSRNPNCYACVLGLSWALLAKRLNLEMPSMVEGSIMIMAKAGSGVAMFSIGLFMALQERLMACGVQLTLYGMLLRFVVGPLTTVIGSLALGLRSKVLKIAIIQAAVPQAVASFVFAQEYDLHANVLSTAVIFGTIVSIPLLIGYYAALDLIH